MIVAGGAVYTPAGIRDLDVHIRNGRIESLRPWSKPAGGDVVDATSLWVLPGAIDGHVHGRDPGFPEKEDFGTLTAAAAAGGVTTVLDMPNTLPSVSRGEILAAKREAVDARAHVDYGLWGMLRSSSTEDDVRSLAEAGAVAFKAYLGYAVRVGTGQVLYTPGVAAEDLEPPAGYGTIARLAPALAAAGLPVAAHAEDPSVLLASAVRVDGYSDLLSSRPATAEAVAVAAMAALGRSLDLRVHIVHLASRAGLTSALAGRAAGAQLTLETCPQYLWLSEADYGRLGAVMKMYPLIRTADDRQALRDALLAGEIEMVGTDHAPHTDADKLQHPLAEAHAGSPGVQTLLLSCLELARQSGDPLRAVPWVTEHPARIFGLYPRKGAIQVGSDADLVLVDPSASTVVTPGAMVSRQRHGALTGLEFSFAIRQVLLRGAPPAPGRGEFLRPA
ncbi:MAG: dihydroorotase family protein [Candidatus Dormibacteraeota bacterium]|nr:dihydroorotase family protein [Candidatus Dormibacteraeota bacterium]